MKGYRLSSAAALVAGALMTIAAAVGFWRITQAVFVLCPGAAFTGMRLLGSDAVLERRGRLLRFRWDCGSCT